VSVNEVVMLNDVEVDDTATSGDSDVATKMFSSLQSYRKSKEGVQSTPSFEGQELNMGKEFRSVHSMDFKFYISELALNYNNDNVATTFKLSLRQVKEWRKQNMLLKQAYYEKNIAVKELAMTERKENSSSEFDSTTPTLSFSGAAELHQHLAHAQQPACSTEQPVLSEAVKPTSTSKARKKSSYSSEYKLRAVAFAEVSTNRAAAREYNVHEKRIREWRKNKEILMNSPKDCRRLKGAGRKPLLNQQIEEALYNWIVSTSNERVAITKIELQQKALELSQKNIPEAKFTASSAWVEGFLKRHSLSVKDQEDHAPAHIDSYSAPTMVKEEEQIYNFESQVQEENSESRDKECYNLGVDDSSSSIPYTKGM